MSGADDKTGRIWNLETGHLVADPFKTVDEVGAVRFSQDLKKLAVTSSRWWGTFHGFEYISPPVFWTAKDKTIVTPFSLRYSDSSKKIYELDASTLITVGASFEEHTRTISGLALSLDCTLLASASYDNTIKLWAFESQLLASFNVLYTAYHLMLSPDPCQIVYTTPHDNNIYLCNTSPEIFASIQPLPQPEDRISASRNPPIADILIPLFR